jgi:hypothetical protein
MLAFLSKNSKVIIVLWIIACLFSIFLSMLPTESGSDIVYLYYKGFLEIFTSLGAAFLCYKTMTVFEYNDLSRKAWGFLSTGLVFWSMGASMYAFYEMSYHEETPFPWYSDFGYLSLFPMAIASLMTFRKRLDVSTPLWGKIAGILIFFIALILGSILSIKGFKMSDTVETDRNLFTYLPHFVTLLYVVFDSLMIAMAVSAGSVLAGGLVGRPWWFVIAGLIVFYSGDTIYSFLGILNEVESQGSVFLDLTWPVAFGLISIAAMLTRNIYEEFNK